ncbi:MAG: hypothetical protein U9Q77_10795 [Candidatus Marinimicrobia bacterium]|nr:hypothetical protein [Candidatus Neomarinimicrobiota bacterium]
MKEDKKIGYSALIVGAISMGEAWIGIVNGHADYLEIFFLGLGLIASLAGIALILHKQNPVVKE